MSHLPRTFCFLCLAIINLSASMSHAQTEPAQKADLRCKLAPGQEVRYAWRAETVDTVSLGGGEPIAREALYEATILVHMTGDSVGREADLTFETLRVRVKTVSGTTEFDSKAPSAPEQGNALMSTYRPLVGLTLKLKLNEQGVITSVGGTAGVMNASPPNVKARGQLIDLDSVQRKFGAMFSSSKSSESVAVGDTWNTSQLIPLGSSLQVELQNKNSCTDLKDQQAVIKSVGNSDPQALAASGQPVQSSSVQLDGEMQWDCGAGQLINQRLKQTIALAIEKNGLIVRTDAETISTLQRQ